MKTLIIVLTIMCSGCVTATNDLIENGCHLYGMESYEMIGKGEKITVVCK